MPRNHAFVVIEVSIGPDNESTRVHMLPQAVSECLCN